MTYTTSSTSLRTYFSIIVAFSATAIIAVVVVAVVFVFIFADVCIVVAFV